MNENEVGKSVSNDQGVMVGVILVMAILIIGGVYMVFSRINTPNVDNIPEATTGLPNLDSTSNNPADLQTDASSLEFQSLDSDIQNIDQAIN
ncbi:MAG: hypothetical protein COX02_00150 [Candidatus Vogelbacteria bacterium CG22_combo_CG10-13_8_21_14_all_37_9]|uniref:Uncharacterized protein n=1 Tax=Candidatus Vogelbacteria bacterium CG22_combo_CG10-13_8_21_14_all_37_9 TaxID=1975046 RepID=A0A2H0BL99_9BACT|nr:MAG: hypothetical protein COX02_00150 [Candidatus Vogelbacteria bacterium CG22_combo_CG10-13_8_21_14_all_37_9]